ncbi:MAG TPA: histidinol-phosphate transaminase, partial [Acidobacteriota bacterium]
RSFHEATLGLIAAGWTARRAGRSPSILSEPAGKPILLNNNENPYGPPAAALDAIRKFAAAGNRYPDQTEENLIRAVARANRLATEHVIVSNGSTELLRMAVTHAGLQRRQLILPHPTFEAIASYAEPLGISIRRVPLKSDGKHDLEAMRRAVSKTGAVIYICNPNNPTGGFTPHRDLAPFIQALPASTFIVVDEAYHEFVDAPEYQTWIHEAPSYPNLLVCRTFSKIYGLAGMRIGYGVGNARVIAELSRFRNQDCINVCGGEAAQAALADRDFVRMCHDQNRQQRDRLAELCRQLGRKYFPSVANFMVVEAGDAKKFREFMASNGIEVGRPFQTLEKFSRISMGTTEEMSRFSEVYRRWRI